MRKKGYKGRCEKKNLSKSMDVCRSYDAIQSVYADILQQDENIQEIRCNVLLDGLSEGDEYYGAAEPPVRCGESHLSGLTEPLRSL